MSGFICHAPGGRGYWPKSDELGGLDGADLGWFGLSPDLHTVRPNRSA